MLGAAARFSPLPPVVGFMLLIAAAVGLYALVERKLDVFVLTTCTHAVFYLLAVWWVMRGSGRHRSSTTSDFVLIIAVALALRLIAFPAPPALTSDAFRYVWDGRIQWAGFNPYLWIPADERLAHLRDAVIYPHINLKEVAVTVYPPFAEMLFAAANIMSDSLTGVKIVMAAFDLLTIYAIWLWLKAEDIPVERLLIYAWHPLPLWELTGQAHIDAVAIGLMMLTVYFAIRGRQGLAGGFLAAAFCTKYFPIVLVPAIWRRWDWRMPTVFIAVAVLLYIPYVMSAGIGVLGFTGDLAVNEGYTAGYGFHIIWLLRDFQLADPPGWLYMAFALAVLAALASIAFFRRQADEIRPADMVLLAGAFIWLTSPHYAWYFVWLVPLLCRHMSIAALAMTLLALLHYVPLAATAALRSYIYFTVFGLPLLIAIAEVYWRWQYRWRSPSGETGEMN